MKDEELKEVSKKRNTFKKQEELTKEVSFSDQVDVVKEIKEVKVKVEKKYFYKPKNIECLVLDDSHVKFTTIQLCSESKQVLMVRKDQVVEK